MISKMILVVNCLTYLKVFLKSLTGRMCKCCGESEGEIKANVNEIVTESLERLKY